MKLRNIITMLAIVVGLAVVTIATSVLLPRYYLIVETPENHTLTMTTSQVGPFVTEASCEKAAERLTEQLMRAENDNSLVDLRGYMVCVSSR